MACLPGYVVDDDEEEEEEGRSKQVAKQAGMKKPGPLSSTTKYTRYCCNSSRRCRGQEEALLALWGSKGSVCVLWSHKSAIVHSL